MDVNFWSGHEQLVGVVVAAVYVVAVVAVRLAGRRTLAQMSAFDIVVTIALGTIVGSTALPSNASVVDGIAVIVTLLLQVVTAAARQRFPVLRRLIDFQPQVLLRDGEIDVRRSPGSAQLTPGDLKSRLRRAGIHRLDEAHLAVLEPAGKISVLPAGCEPGRAKLFEELGGGDPCSGSR
jgi:uncharacterized membrane protein YcaP (DUF421 family)